MAKRRGIAGENNPAAKLSNGQVYQLRSDWLAGASQQELVAKYQVSAACVCRTVNGKSRGEDWPPIPDVPEGSVLVPDYPGYAVSKTGNVYSRMSKAGDGTTWLRWKKMKGRVNDDGYVEVHLTNHLGDRLFRVHTLVLTTFVGPCPLGMECCHGNDIKTDNGLDNLRWGTDQDNSNDRLIRGRTAKGERNGNAKATEMDVVAVLEMRSNGMGVAQIAEATGLTVHQVGRMASRETWKHVKIDADRSTPIWRSELLDRVQQKPPASGE